jgi:SAM-dependent methyltransferase
VTNGSQGACTLCGSQGETLLTKETTSELVVLARCGRCDAIFNEHWQQLASAETYEYYGERLEWPADRLHDPLNTKRYVELLARLAKDAPGHRLLDVGCGVGHLVKVAADRGWNAEGIELSPEAVEICRRFGLACRVEDFFSGELEGGRYDLITMIEVIEHVQRPQHFLRRAAELLAAGGVLYLTTPNFNALSRRLLGKRWSSISNEHLTYFTPTTLQRTCKRSGFEVLDLETRNISIAELSRIVPRHRASTNFQGSPSASPDYPVRARIESSPVLRRLKRTADRLLTAVGWGETLALTARGNP